MILGGFDGEAAHDLNDVWSYDGNSWVMLTEHAGWSGRDGHCSVVFKGSIYVLGGTDDPYHCKCDVWKSDDGGCNWEQITSSAPWPERWQHAACVHDERIYVIGGWGEHYLNDVWSSPDGILWTLECAKAPWKPRMFLSVMNFNDAIYVM
jgi:N-acetylneuraminic acid mutarotase